MNPLHRFAAVILCLIAVATTASSCPSCFGQAQGPLIDGMNKAILAMIGITGFVLTGFVALFVSIGRKTKQHDADALATASNTEQGAS